jgi:hypothetical protein
MAQSGHPTIARQCPLLGVQGNNGAIASSYAANIGIY